MNDFLNNFKACVSGNYEETGAAKNRMTEGVNINVSISSKGQYLLYKFDKEGPELFPFFTKVTKLKAKADYVIVTKTKDKIYVLVIELKQNNGDPRNQIQATKHFVEYLIKSVDRTKKKKYSDKLELRGIEYSKLALKGNSKPKPKYDKFKNTPLSGNSLILKNYLF